MDTLLSRISELGLLGVDGYHTHEADELEQVGDLNLAQLVAGEIPRRIGRSDGFPSHGVLVLDGPRQTRHGVVLFEERGFILGGGEHCGFATDCRGFVHANVELVFTFPCRGPVGCFHPLDVARELVGVGFAIHRVAHGQPVEVPGRTLVVKQHVAVDRGFGVGPHRAGTNHARLKAQLVVIGDDDRNGLALDHLGHVHGLLLCSGEDARVLRGFADGNATKGALESCRLPGRINGETQIPGVVLVDTALVERHRSNQLAHDLLLVGVVGIADRRAQVVLERTSLRLASEDGAQHGREGLDGTVEDQGVGHVHVGERIDIRHARNGLALGVGGATVEVRDHLAGDLRGVAGGDVGGLDGDVLGVGLERGACDEAGDHHALHLLHLSFLLCFFCCVVLGEIARDISVCCVISGTDANVTACLQIPQSHREARRRAEPSVNQDNRGNHVVAEMQSRNSALDHDVREGRAHHNGAKHRVGEFNPKRVQADVGRLEEF